MVMYLWIHEMLFGGKIKMNNHGDMWRDFTYVEDAVDGTIAAINSPKEYEIYNIAGGRVVRIGDLLDMVKSITGKTADVKMMDMPEGEVLRTEGDISRAREHLGYNPKVSIEEGVANVVKWFYDYYHI
jgi:UDP-glucuronate 4-epimerase